MASRTIRKVYATVVTMFRTAVADELIPFSGRRSWVMTEIRPTA
jgi:hypothetical protein